MGSAQPIAGANTRRWPQTWQARTGQSVSRRVRPIGGRAGAGEPWTRRRGRRSYNTDLSSQSQALNLFPDVR
jgi:hypothetical protein